MIHTECDYCYAQCDKLFINCLCTGGLMVGDKYEYALMLTLVC